MNYETEDGHSYSHFDPEQYAQCDARAREIVAELLTSRGAIVENNDGKFAGSIDYSATDLRARFSSGRVFYIEVEMKRREAWKHVADGIHIPFRKVNSAFGVKKIEPENVQFMLVNESLSELIAIRGEYAKMAFDIWPEYAGFGRVIKSKGFVMPKHGCYPLKKKTFRDQETPEDFINIAFKRANVISRLAPGKFMMLQQSDGKFL